MKSIFTIVLLLTGVSLFSQTNYHVKKTGNDANDGLSWNTAFLTIQRALAAATEMGDKVLVASGTYYADEGPGVTNNDRDTSFYIPFGVSVHGSYEGVQGQYSQNRLVHPSILDGDIQQDNNLTNNTRRIVVIEELRTFGNPTAENAIDGFNIINGYGLIGSNPTSGAGVYVRLIQPGVGLTVINKVTINNCSFRNNSALIGGAVLLSNLSLNKEVYIAISNCEFFENFSNDGGSAIHNAGFSGTIGNCQFVNNGTLTSIATIYNQGEVLNPLNASPAIANCYFTNNLGHSVIYNNGKNSNSSPDLFNCVFTNNRENVTVYNMGENGKSSPTFRNCSFFNATPGSTSSGSRPAIFSYAFNGIGNVVLANCIVWNNSPTQFSQVSGATTTSSYSIIKGAFPGGTWFTPNGTDGGNNSDEDPAFVDPGEGNIRLQTCSPAIDAGDNTVIRVNPDPDGNNRVINGVIDIGAYEYAGGPDIFPPTVKTKNIGINLDANGVATITANSINDGSWDACGIKSMTVKPSAFSCNTIGPQTVTLTVIDNNDNEATATAIVTVNDNTAPQAKCRNVVIQLDANGNASLTTAQVDNGSTDACGIKRRTLSQNNFTCSDVGNKEVTLFVTDNNDNTSSCTATITIEDKVLPTAICKDVTVYLDVNGTASITPNQVDNGSSDVCGIKTLQLDKTSFNCSDKGTNTVQLTVIDNNGNTATCSAIVTVLDNIPPVINSISANPNWIWPPDLKMKPVTVNATVIDNCPGTTWRISGVAIVEGEGINANDPDWEITGANTVNVRAEIPKKSIRRLYRLTITATDASGNTSTRTTDVIISKNPPPTTETITRSSSPNVEANGGEDLPTDVLVFPNPSASEFAIKLSSKEEQMTVTMQVMDIYGRIIETIKANGNSIIRIGGKYRPGTYFVKIMQAKRRHVLKLIKTH